MFVEDRGWLTYINYLQRINQQSVMYVMER